MTEDPTHTVLVTGASAGIGAAIAAAFARRRDRLILCARRADRLEGVAARLRDEHGAAIHTLELDVRDAAAVEHAIAGIPADFASVDVLVNNAGLSRALAPVYANEVRHIDDMVDTNVKGLLYVTRAVVPGMVARGRGHVVNIGSTAGHAVYPGGTVYAATKHAVDAITRGLKMDLHRTPIRVSTIDPGLVETDFSLVRFEGDAERASAVYANTQPLTPDDVAEAVLWAVTRPSHVNVSEIILMPTVQSSVTMIARDDKS
jgi:3-hydroxy acid dehydrogenase / malonic semialdehyde reductase